MTPRPLAAGDRVLCVDERMAFGRITVIADDRCTVLIETTATARVVFCDRLLPAAPAESRWRPCTLRDGRP